jgi:hypothetical protein
MKPALAKDLALEVFRQPILARRLQKQQLPDGMLDVIKIAAGDSATLNPNADDPQLHNAAIFFLQQALLSNENDNFRLLGLNPNANLDEIREHRRWLLKWLHPDRNHNKWESTLFARVNAAATQLEAAHGMNAVLNISTLSKTPRHRKKTLRRFQISQRKVWPRLMRLLKLTIRIAIAAAALALCYVGYLRFDLNQASIGLANLAKGLGN